MAHAGKPIETSDELIERLGGYKKYNLLWDEVLKECGARNGVIFYGWSRTDTFQLSLIQDFIKDARLRPADAQTLTERLDRLVFSEIDRDDEMFRDVEERIVSLFKSRLSGAGIEVSDDFPWDDVIGDAKDLGVFRENIGGFLHDTKVPCVFVLSTPGEAKDPDTLNQMRLALYGDDEFDPCDNDPELERNFWANSVSWLTKQQGYGVCDLFPIDDASEDRMRDSKFLYSILYEFSAASPCISPCLAVLAELTPAQLVEVLAADDRNIEFPENVSIGLYDQEVRSAFDFVSTRSGSFLIELEKPLVVPKELLSYIDVETPDSTDAVSRAGAAKCGFTDEAWKPGVVMTDVPTPSIAELKASLPMEEIWRTVQTRMEQVDREWNESEDLDMDRT